jgi:hypothetical protein
VKSRGRGILKQEWYSICSMHIEHDKTCAMCNTGTYYNIYRVKCSQIIYDNFPNLWRWWVNL